MATIVVGVDGSAGAEEALRFAVREAELRGARLRAVTAWHVSTPAFAGDLPVDVDPSEFERNAVELLDDALAALGEEVANVEVERVTREGQPAQVLVEEAEDAELLVVGSRGHGGFVGLLVGSVSQQCVHHAPCPVAIVRERGESG